MLFGPSRAADAGVVCHVVGEGSAAGVPGSVPAGVPEVAHYPPYCSKHNPIEHRVFPHVTRACEGVIFHSVSLVKQLIERTRTGLRVTVDILDHVYAAGHKAAADLQSTPKLVADATLPKWNYTLHPNHPPIPERGL